MAFDGLLMSAVVDEFKAELVGAKIEKIMQPEPDMLVMQIRTADTRKRLLIDVSSSGSRVQFTNLTFENPLEAPTFCMLLRKQIQGGIILSVEQVGKERIVEFEIEALNEIGSPVIKRLIAEIMGRHSNIVLVDGLTEKIIDSLKHISYSVNRYRQILPGFTYERPPVVNMNNDLGLGPSAKQAVELGADINERVPSVYFDENNKPKDFHVIDLKEYDGCFKKVTYDSLTQALDVYYSSRPESNRVMQKGDNLLRTIKTIIDKLLLKKQRLLEDIKRSEEADIYRIKGEILNSNLHLVKAGEKKVRLTSFYDGSEIDIELDEKLSPAKNAQSYFKRYNKAKGSKKEKLPLLKATEADINYLESLAALISSCKNYEELDAIRAELAEGGYIRVNKKAVRNKTSKPKPRRFKLHSGLEVLVGRNNLENDYITFKMGEKTDWWFHTKDIHGSHVVMVCHGVDPSPEDMYEAAGIAAYYSKGKDSENVPVDYCMLKRVKKPNGAKPGMVIFKDNGTVWVNPINPDTNIDNYSI